MNLKNKPSIQVEQEQNHRYGEQWDDGQWSGRSGGMGEKMQGLGSTNWQLQERHSYVKSKYRKWSCQRTYMHDPWS